jgi:hypothetical protein
MSNSQKGNTNKRGKSLTEETKLKISNSKKGIKPNRVYFVSEETKLKISKTLKNRSKTK